MPLIQTDKPIYYIAEDGVWPVTEQEIRSAHPNTSFPTVFSAPDGYNPVFPAPIPAFGTITQTAAEAAPALIDGEWVQQWEITDLPQEQIAANLAAARAAKWEAIKAERDRRKYLGVKVVGHWFHSDDPSRIQQLALVMMGAGIPPGLQWKTFTLTPPPVFVTMTQTLAQQIFQATALSDQSIFSVAESHRIAMEASDRPDLYDFNSGWPATIYDEAGQ